MEQNQQIRMAAAFKKMSHAQIAQAIGQTASNFSQKLNRNTFTDDELRQIAEALGAKFRPAAFVFPDGTEI